MKPLTWAEYYNSFYSWEESAQQRNLHALASLGPADEVGEIIIELQGCVPAANYLLKMAVDAKLAFSADDLIEMWYMNDRALAAAAVYNAAARFTAEDIESLYNHAGVDDEIITDICAKRHLPLPEDLRDEEDEPDEPEEEDEADAPDEEEEAFDDEPDDEPDPDSDEFWDDAGRAEPKSGGFFSLLLAALGAAAAACSTPPKRSVKCNGDCANCPPHYGYRHGRWYYGRGHTKGCEFGGNKGDGGTE